MTEEAGALGSSFDQTIRPVIDLVDELRSCGLSNDIQLPAVVVVGDQSSGKSSILEGLSGVELPRGSGIMTRCPLVMEMKQTKEWSAMISTSKSPPRSISSPKQLREAIAEAQNEIAGTNKMVSRSEITLRINSPNAADLTLVDLPGITRLAVEDQPEDMPQQIKRLVMEYIQRDNTIILCVISGNLDIAVNESVRLAQECDPTGHRTLGVITKPDLVDSMDGKQNVIKLLNGNLINMKKGFVMVRCRPIDEVDEYSLAEAVEKEREYFKSDKVYGHADQTKMTLPILSGLLTQNLVELIKNKIPEMRDSMSKLRLETKKSIDELPKAPPSDDIGRQAYLAKILGKFQVSLERAIVYGETREFVEHGGNFYLQWNASFEKYAASIHQISAEFMSQKATDQYFQREIKLCQGSALSSMFISFEMIRDIVLHMLDDYLTPSEVCKEEIGNTLEVIMMGLSNKYFSQIPAIKSFIEDLCRKAKSEQDAIVTKFLKFHIKEEKRVFTQKVLLNQEFNVCEAAGSSAANEQALDSINASRTRNLALAYFKIMNRRLADQIPACILHTYNVKLVKSLGRKLIALYDDTTFHNLAAENPELASKRSTLTQRLKRLELGENKLASFT